MIRLLLIVGLGGFLGSIARFAFQQGVDRWLQTSYPIGLFLINILGSFLIGIVFGLALYRNILSDEWRLFLATGFCGGFTTFSAFSFDNLKMIENHQFMQAFLYSGGSVVLGILAAFVGIILVRVV